MTPPNTSDNLPPKAFEIYVSVGLKGWTARCYEYLTGNHVWSSEEAATVSTALREIADGIDRARNSEEAPV